MLITSYNQETMGDVLIAILAPDAATQTTKKSGQFVAIYGEQGELIGLNVLEASKLLTDLEGAGQIFLTEEQVEKINAGMTAAGLEGELVADSAPKFVIGKVKELTEHPDSDHLHITQVDFGTHTEQIVCGAPNVALGQTVVAALPGAMMPDGKIIWPGALRGVKSDGMLASARELGIPNAPQVRGILEMPDSIPAGTAFDFDKAAVLLAAK